jgi:hypothetical protein
LLVLPESGRRPAHLETKADGAIAAQLPLGT